MQSAPHKTLRATGPSACLSCRRRKSRCKFDGLARECLMCRAHQTQCIMPQRFSAKDHQYRRTPVPRSAIAAAGAIVSPPTPNEPAIPVPVNNGPQTSPDHHDGEYLSVISDITAQQDSVAVSLEATEEDNAHVISPATAGDSHYLEDYLTSMQDGPSRAIRPALPGATSESVVFMRVKKKPLGLDLEPDPSAAKLQTIVKLLEPWQDKLLNLYFSRGNECFPILNEHSFRRHHLLSRVSPAVVACLYAHSMCYWNYDRDLRPQHRPDGRFIWNIALSILYTELHISPGMSTIIAILLNIGGRPTTTMVGNGMLLGSAIALAQSLGLNRNPQAWNITEDEKTLRMHIWWCLVIHDRWTSLTYGTPPHIRQSYYDVPLPKTRNHESSGSPDMFQTLASLTSVLGLYIEQLYSKNAPLNRGEAMANLEAWTDTLQGEQRRIVVRGTPLDKRGAANLRMCYLTARFFMCRFELNTEMDSVVVGQPLSDRLSEMRRMAEDIVLFVRELTDKQLGDFWLSTMSCVFLYHGLPLTACSPD